MARDRRRVHEMTAEQHDRVFASVSHLPHVLSFALVEQILNAPDAALKFSFAAGGFRDFTRIAASSPEMWRDVCVANRAALLDELDAYTAVLAHLRAAIEAADGAALEAVFERSRAARTNGNKAGRSTPPMTPHNNRNWTRSWNTSISDLFRVRPARSGCPARRAFLTACCCSPRWPKAKP